MQGQEQQEVRSNGCWQRNSAQLPPSMPLQSVLMTPCHVKPARLACENEFWPHSQPQKQPLEFGEWTLVIDKTFLSIVPKPERGLLHVSSAPASFGISSPRDCSSSCPSEVDICRHFTASSDESTAPNSIEEKNADASELAGRGCNVAQPECDIRGNVQVDTSKTPWLFDREHSDSGDFHVADNVAACIYEEDIDDEELMPTSTVGVLLGGLSPEIGTVQLSKTTKRNRRRRAATVASKVATQLACAKDMSVSNSVAACLSNAASENRASKEPDWVQGMSTSKKIASKKPDRGIKAKKLSSKAGTSTPCLISTDVVARNQGLASASVVGVAATDAATLELSSQQRSKSGSAQPKQKASTSPSPTNAMKATNSAKMTHLPQHATDKMSAYQHAELKNHLIDFFRKEHGSTLEPGVPCKEPVGVLSVEQLARFGSESSRILISIYGDLFDVSTQKAKFGPGGPCSFWAGKDVTWSVVTGLQSLENFNRFYNILQVQQSQLASICKYLAYFESDFGAPVGRLDVYEHEEDLPDPPLDETMECVVQ